MKKKVYDKIKVPLSIVPKDLASELVKCDVCGTSFKFNWLEKRPLENRVTTKSGSGVWLRAGVVFKCPKCGWNYNRPIEPLNHRFEYNFYGDEAYRFEDSNKFSVFVYALIAENPLRKKSLIALLQDIKREALPEKDPNSWVLHVKDFFSEHSRRRNELFSSWDNMDVQRILKFAQNKIASTPESTSIFCSTAICKMQSGVSRRNHLRYIRLESFLHLIADILRTGGSVGMRPNFIFESDGKDGWADAAFLGFSKTPLFSALSRSMDIKMPQFKPKNPNELTELADVIAFTVARHLYKVVNEQNVDVFPSEFGEIAWYGFSSSGEPIYCKKVGFPWQEFYGITF